MRHTRDITTAAIAATLAGMTAASVQATGLDVLLLRDDVNGRIRTGSFFDPTETIVSLNERVFEAEFGETDPMQPNFSDEPGFRALDGDFDGGFWGFNFLDAVRVWNGSDFSTISDYTISASFGPSPTITTSAVAGGFVAGFNIPVGAGGFDDHLELFLDAPGDDSADGIYLLTLEVFSNDLGASRPIFFVFGRGVDEFDLDLAVDYVRSSVIPTPGAFGLLALAGVASLRRRRC